MLSFDDPGDLFPAGAERFVRHGESGAARFFDQYMQVFRHVSGGVGIGVVEVDDGTGDGLRVGGGVYFFRCL